MRYVGQINRIEGTHAQTHVHTITSLKSTFGIKKKESVKIKNRRVIIYKWDLISKDL